MVGEICHLGLFSCCVPNLSYVLGMALSAVILELAGKPWPGCCQLHSRMHGGGRIRAVQKCPREVLVQLMEEIGERLGKAGTFCTCLGVELP